DPTRRYATALELADDLRRFLDGQPIHARPTNWLRWAAKLARRHPDRVSVAAVLAAVCLGLAGHFAHHRQAVADTRAQAQLQRLLEARTADVPDRLTELHPLRDRVTRRLDALFAGEEGNERDRQRAALALADRRPEAAEYLCRQVGTASPEEVGLICTA